MPSLRCSETGSVYSDVDEELSTSEVTIDEILSTSAVMVLDRSELATLSERPFIFWDTSSLTPTLEFAALASSYSDLEISRSISLVSLSRLFLSRSRIFYFSSNNVFRIDFKIVPEAKFFLKMRNAFLLFYQIWKGFLLSAFGGLSHSGKKTIFSWWLIWMARDRKVTDSNSY